MQASIYNMAQLKEARAAYHALQTGGAVKAVVDQNGERVEFTQANSTRLKAYIQEMESALGCCSVAQAAIGPMGFLF